MFIESWAKIQREIATCSKCTDQWNDTAQPLQLGEIPDPPEVVRLLFVGVAPTPIEGKTHGSHFYSSVDDLLRVGLFKILTEKFRTNLLNLGLAESNEAFHRTGCFFVHCAKVRPIRDPAPPVEAICYCAAFHLRQEIRAIRPAAICFLGINNAGPAASALFGKSITGEPALVSLDEWSGWVAVAHQPRRGWERNTRVIIDRLISASRCLDG